MRARARAHANIALVKYWGKRDEALNLPAAGSLSVTLDGLTTTTEVVFESAGKDTLIIDGVRAGDRSLDKILRVVEPIRQRAGLDLAVRIESTNSFPTGAGLASSASGLAALTVAASRAAGLDLSPDELSRLARLGSGSACRSIHGGYVEWQAGSSADGSDSYAVPLFPPEHWDLRVVVAVLQDRPKPVDSTRGMLDTARRSPYFGAYVASVDEDLEQARRAIATRDIERLGRVAERSCLRMHAAMMASDPPLIYLLPESWQVIDIARQLRRQGMPLFFTADAGPNVKIFCSPEVVSVVEQTLTAQPGVRRLIHARPGTGAQVLEP